VYFCAAAPAPAPCGEIDTFWVCRPAGEYERMEDLPQDLQIKWGQVPSLTAEATPRRRRRLLVERVGSAETLPPIVVRRAEQLLAFTGGRGVPWGTLLRVPCDEGANRHDASPDAPVAGRAVTIARKESTTKAKSAAESGKCAPARVSQVAAVPSLDRDAGSAGAAASTATQAGLSLSPPVQEAGRQPERLSFAARTAQFWHSGYFSWRGTKRLACMRAANADPESSAAREPGVLPTARPVAPNPESSERARPRPYSAGAKVSAAPFNRASVLGALPAAAPAPPSEADAGVRIMCMALEGMAKGSLRRLGLEDPECVAALQAGAEDEGRFGRVYPMAATAEDGARLLLKLFKPVRGGRGGGDGAGAEASAGERVGETARPACPTLAPLLEMFHLLRCRKIPQASVASACLLSGGTSPLSSLFTLGRARGGIRSYTCRDFRGSKGKGWLHAADLSWIRRVE
jgi:hypothetical protein